MSPDEEITVKIDDLVTANADDEEGTA